MALLSARYFSCVIEILWSLTCDRMVLMVVCWRYRMPFDANGCVSTLVNVDWLKWMYFCVNDFEVGVNDNNVNFLVMNSKRCNTVYCLFFHLWGGNGEWDGGDLKERERRLNREIMEYFWTQCCYLKSSLKMLKNMWQNVWCQNNMQTLCHVYSILIFIVTLWFPPCKQPADINN